MSLPFLKVSPEEAIALIQEMILAGYRLKDRVNAEHEQARIVSQDAVVAAAPGWSREFTAWINESLAKLDDIYESQVYAYNFRDANTSNGLVMVGNTVRSDVILGTHSRIEKLNEYERFIREHVTVEVSAGRDIYLINGDGANVKTKN
ncbi:MAG TPA: hypothetical protein VLG92_04740 [Candidatus Saccharimonadia bacterium]|nr:hypothetical protein [Candidatus Saccharimonadia bacterium]